jgi:hypothetical protein
VVSLSHTLALVQHRAACQCSMQCGPLHSGCLLRQCGCVLMAFPGASLRQGIVHTHTYYIASTTADAGLALAFRWLLVSKHV